MLVEPFLFQLISATSSGTTFLNRTLSAIIGTSLVDNNNNNNNNNNDVFLSKKAWPVGDDSSIMYNYYTTLQCYSGYLANDRLIFL